MDPIVGYFYKNYVLGVESSAAKIMATWAAGATFINAVAGNYRSGSCLHGSTPGIEKDRTVFPYLRKTGNARRKIYGFRGQFDGYQKKGVSFV